MANTYFPDSPDLEQKFGPLLKEIDRKFQLIMETLRPLRENTSAHFDIAKNPLLPQNVHNLNKDEN